MVAVITFQNIHYEWKTDKSRVKICNPKSDVNETRQAVDDLHNIEAINVRCILKWQM